MNPSTAATRNAVRRQRRPLNDAAERMQNVRDILDQALQIAQETMECLENKRAVDTLMGKKGNNNMGNNNNKGK